MVQNYPRRISASLFFRKTGNPGTYGDEDAIAILMLILGVNPAIFNASKKYGALAWTHKTLVWSNALACNNTVSSSLPSNGTKPVHTPSHFMYHEPSRLFTAAPGAHFKADDLVSLVRIFPNVVYEHYDALLAPDAARAIFCLANEAVPPAIEQGLKFFDAVGPPELEFPSSPGFGPRAPCEPIQGSKTKEEYAKAMEDFNKAKAIYKAAMPRHTRAVAKFEAATALFNRSQAPVDNVLQSLGGDVIMPLVTKAMNTNCHRLSAEDTVCALLQRLNINEIAMEVMAEKFSTLTTLDSIQSLPLEFYNTFPGTLLRLFYKPIKHMSTPTAKTLLDLAHVLHRPDRDVISHCPSAKADRSGHC